MARGGYSAENVRNPTLEDLLGFDLIVEDDFGSIGTRHSEKTDKHRKMMPLTITVGSVKVTLKTGSYFTEKVDAIANIVPTNLDLSYDLGSHAMLKMAGDAMQEKLWEDNPDRVKPWSVMMTRGYGLRCQFVFHVVVMDWSEEIATRVEQRLLNALTEILWKCQKHDVRTLSLPPFGTGYLGFKAKTVAKIFLRAIQDFVKGNRVPSLQEITFVIGKAESVVFQNFEKEMKKASERKSKTDLDKFVEGAISIGKVVKGVSDLMSLVHVEEQDKVDHESRHDNQDQKHSRKSVRKQDSQDKGREKQHVSHSKNIGNVSINLKRGSLVHRKVDVIVNETNTRLSLRNGGLSGAISKAAGEKLQSECNKLYPNGLEMGDIGRTRAFNIRGVKAIYHTTLPTYGTKQTPPDEVLRLLVQCCLGKATEERFRSIAFPALGTGSNEYPSKVSAFNVMSAVSDFLHVNPSTSIRTIEIVVFEADKNFEEIMKDFQQELDNIVMRAANRTLHIQDTSSDHVVESHINPERDSAEWFTMMKGQDVCIPVHWTSVPAGQIARQCQTSGQNDYTLEDVDTITERAIKDLVQRSWEMEKVGQGKDAKNLASIGFTSLQVTRIQRVENVHLYKGYAEERQRLFHKASSIGSSLKAIEQTKFSSGGVKTDEILQNHPEVWTLTSDIFPEINEHFLFHGTSKDNVRKLLSQGIDNRLAGDNAMFGPGIYAAESSTKADQYSDAKANRTKRGLQMLLLRMCLGEAYVCQEPGRFKKAPCKSCRKDKCICRGGNQSDFYDSVLGDGQWLFREFVVYEKRQVYPEYLISYDRV